MSAHFLRENVIHASIVVTGIAVFFVDFNYVFFGILVSLLLDDIVYEILGRDMFDKSVFIFAFL